MDERYEEAAQLAADYNWAAEAALLRKGKLPTATFGREVGEAVALFMARPVISIGSRSVAEEEERNSRAHGKRLARLRLLLALLSIEERKKEARG